MSHTGKVLQNAPFPYVYLHDFSTRFIEHRISKPHVDWQETMAN